MRKNKRHKPTHKPFNSSRTPKTEAGIDPDAFWKMSPKWCFKYIDSAHARWAIDAETIDAEFLNKLIDYERQTWGEILQATSGKRKGTRNHSIPTARMGEGPRKRLIELKRFEDALYSIRIKNKHRWWGLIINGVFHFVWSDRYHEVCPVLPR